MSRQRKIKEEFWFIALFVAIVAFALIADWWKEHPALGWLILIGLLAGLACLVYRFASVRGWVKVHSKRAIEKMVFEQVAHEREPLPANIRDEVLARARNCCENESCNFSGKPHIHHIDMDNSNNRLPNLIALCPNCHQKAHGGVFTQSQLSNWVRRDFQRLRARRARS